MDIKKFYGKLTAFANTPKYVFFLSLTIAALSTILYTLFLTDVYRDTTHVYAPYVRELAQGNWSEGIATQVPMLNITLAGVFAFLGLEPVKALTLVAGLFYLAACFPLRSLLERYVSPLAAAWGCVLYAGAPKMIRFACAPLLESSRIFFLIAAVLFFLRTTENPKWKNALLFGVSAGLMTVSRGEGMALSAVLLLGLPIYVGLFCRPAAWGKVLASWGIAIVCTFAIISPFCAMNYSKCGIFAPDTRIKVIIDVCRVKLFPGSVVQKAQPPRVQQEQDINQSAMKKMSPAEKASHNFSSFVRGGYELYWLLAMIGAAAIIRRKQWRADYLVFLGTTLMYFTLYLVTISAYRYYLFLIPLFMVFTITGAGVLRDLAIKYLPYKVQFICVIACTALLIGQFANGINRAFSSKGKDFIKAGKWIEKYNKTHFPDRKLKLFSPMMSEVGYWSKADLTDGFTDVSHNPATFKDFDLAVVHRKRSYGMEKRSDLERIPDTPHSKNIWIFKVKKQENK